MPHPTARTRHRTLTGFALAGLMLIGGRLGLVSAQCPGDWLPTDGIPGTNGAATVLTSWDPDGAGPAPERVVLGGPFLVAGKDRKSVV